MKCDGGQMGMEKPLVWESTRAVASSARVYDCYLRGTSHFPVDMEVAGKVLVAAPYARALAKASRKFSLRAAHLMARRGVTQFLDLGCGLASVPPYVHETVSSVSGDTHVLYVDNERDVCINNPALTAFTRASFIRADIRQTASLLAEAEDHEFIDLSQPLGVLLGAVLHFITWDQAYLIVPTLTEHLAAGSYLAVSHVTSTGTDPGAQAAVEAAYASASIPVAFRKRHEIHAFFEGWELVRPGLIDITQWRGNGQAAPPRFYGVKVLGGVARKP